MVHLNMSARPAAIAGRVRRHLVSSSSSISWLFACAPACFKHKL
jgi:hypothetical protein